MATAGDPKPTSGPSTMTIRDTADRTRRTAPPITHASGATVPDRHLIWPISEPQTPTAGVDGPSTTPPSDSITPLPPTHPVGLPDSGNERQGSSPSSGAAERGSRPLSIRDWFPWPIQRSKIDFRRRQSSVTTAVESIRLGSYRRKKPGDPIQTRRDDTLESTKEEDEPTGPWQTPSPGLGMRWSTRQKFKAIMALVAGFCQQWLCWGLIMGYGTVLAYFESQDPPLTSLTILALIGTIPAFIILFGSLVLGVLVDAGYHRWTNGLGCMLLLAGLVGMTYSGHFDDGVGKGSVWNLVLSVIPLGIGQACLFITSSQVPATWFPHKKELVMGFTSSGAAVGGFLYPLMFKTLASKRDYRFSMWMVFTVTFALSLIINLFSIPSPNHEHRPLRQPRRLHTWIPLRAFRSRAMILHICAMICLTSGILVTPFFLQYWADRRGLAYVPDIFKHTGQDIGQSDNRDVYLTCLLNGMQLSGLLLGPLLSETFRARHIHAVSAVLSTLALLFWPFTANFAIAAIFCAIFGQLTGLMISLPVNDVADILGPRRVACSLNHYSGLVYSIASPFVIVGPVVAGVLIERVGLDAAAYWVAGCFVLGAGFLEASCYFEDNVGFEAGHGGEQA